MRASRIAAHDELLVRVMNFHPVGTVIVCPKVLADEDIHSPSVGQVRGGESLPVLGVALEVGRGSAAGCRGDYQLVGIGHPACGCVGHYYGELIGLDVAVGEAVFESRQRGRGGLGHVRHGRRGSCDGRN